MSRIYPRATAEATPAKNTATTSSTDALDRHVAATQPSDGIASPLPAPSSGASSKPAYPASAFPDIADDLSGCIMIAHFPDAFAAWLRDPMPKAEALAALAPLCGGKPQIEDRKARFNPAYRQRILLRQPSRQAIEYLAKRNDALFNYQELAQDLIYQTEEECKAAFGFYIEHVLKKDRRGGQSFKICLGDDGRSTAYSDARKSKSVSVAYPTTSKATRDPGLHIEDRSKGPRMLKRKGSGSLKDLLSLDYLQFWQDHSQFWRITDHEGLGRTYLNLSAKEKDPEAKAARKPRIIKIGNTTATYNEDKRMGHQLERVLGLFSPDQITFPKLKAKAAKKEKWEYPGYWNIYAACSIQNIYDRLNHLMPLAPFISRIDALSAVGSQSANSEIARSMRVDANQSPNQPPLAPCAPSGAKALKKFNMSNKSATKEINEMSKRSRRYGSDPHDAAPEQRTPTESSLEHQDAKETATKATKAAQADKHAAEIEKLKAKYPDIQHWGYYPDEE